MSYNLDGFIGAFNSVTNSRGWQGWVDSLRNNDQESLAGFAEHMRGYKGTGRPITVDDVKGNLLNYTGEGDYQLPNTITGNDLINRYLLTSSYESNKKSKGYGLNYDPYYKGLKNGTQDLFGYELSTLHQISFDVMFNYYMAKKANESSFTTYQAFGYANTADVKLSDTKANSLINSLDISESDQLGSNYTYTPPADSDGDGYTDDVDEYPDNENYWDAASKKDYDDKQRELREEELARIEAERIKQRDAYEATLSSAELFRLAMADGINQAEARRLSDLGRERAQEETDAKNAIDTDNDGRPDWKDDFPNDSSEQDDSDSDGVGDNADDFPNDATETTDSDNDGVGDNADYRKHDASIQDFADWNATDEGDLDGDKTKNKDDAFPNDPNETKDSDGDGVGDNADKYDNDPLNWSDNDGDGKADQTKDAFPDDGSEWLDTDKDSVGDNSDYDKNNSSIKTRDDYERVLKEGPYEDVDRFLEAYNLVRKGGGRAIGAVVI